MKTKSLVLLICLLSSCANLPSLNKTESCSFPMDNNYPGGLVNYYLKSNDSDLKNKLQMGNLKFTICRDEDFYANILAPIPLTYSKNKIEVILNDELIDTLSIENKFYSPLLFAVVFVFSLAGALSSMYFSKKQRDAAIKMSKTDTARQEFVSVAVDGIENVKGLALELSIKDAWREVEANYIIANEELQKKSGVLQNVNSTINQLMTAMFIFVGVHLVFSG